MKLHLPFGLRKALLACLAAIAAHTLSFTVSAGSAAVSGAVVFSFLASQHALAADEEEGDAEPTPFPDTTGWAEEELESGAETTISQDTIITLKENAGDSGMYTITGADGENIRLQLIGGKEATKAPLLTLKLLGALSTVSLEAAGRFKIEADSFSNAIRDIYLGKGGQLWFAGNYTGENKLSATFHLTTTNFVTGWDNALDFAALALENNVETDGGLELSGDSKIGTHGGITFTINGVVNGADYELDIVSNSGTSTIVFNGGGKLGSLNYTHTSNKVNITFGKDFTLTNGGYINGELKINSSLVTLTNGDLLTIDSTDIYGGSLTITGDVQVNGILKSRSNNGTGKLTINGELSGTSTLQLWGGELTLAKGGAVDRIDSTWGNASSILCLGGDLEFNSRSATNLGFTVKKMAGASGAAHLMRVVQEGESVSSMADVQAFFDGFGMESDVGIGFVSTAAHTFTGGGTLDKDFHFKGNGSGTLLLSGSEAYQFNKALTITNGSVSVADGSYFSVGGDLVLNTNGELIVQSGNVSLTSVTVNGAGAGISMLSGSKLYLTGLSLATGVSGLQITLLDIDAQEGSGTWDIFSKIWNEIKGQAWLSHLSFVDKNGQALEFNLDSGCVWFGEYVDPTLWFDGDSLTWSAGSNTDWRHGQDGKTGADFNGGEDVVFNSEGDNVSVQVEGSVQAAIMTVERGGYSFTGDALTIKQMELKQSTSVSFGNSVTITGKLTGTGSLTVNSGGKLILQSETAQEFEGSLSLEDKSSLTLGADLTLTDLSGSGDASIAANGNTIGITGTNSVWNNGALNIDDGSLMLGAAAKMTLNKGGSADGLMLGKGAELSLGSNFIINSLSVSAEGATITRSGGTTPVFLVIDTGTTDVSKPLLSWFNGIENLSFDEGTGLGKTGSGKLTLTGGGTINGAFYIEEGSVQFDGAGFTFDGPITGAGTLVLAGGEFRTAAAKYFVLRSGGNMTGRLALSEWSAQVRLGADLIVGGLEDKDGAGLHDNRYVRSIGLATDEQMGGKTAPTSVTLTINLLKGQSASIDSTDFLSGVNVVKDGEGTQYFTGTNTFAGDLSIKAGTLSFEGNTQVNGLLKGSGNLEFSSGSLTLSSSDKHSFSGSLTLGDATSGNTTLNLTSELTVSSLTNLSGNVTLQDGGSLTVSNNASLAGNLTINSSSLSIEGNAIFSGSVDINQSQLTIEGDATISNSNAFKVRDPNAAIRVKGAIKGSAILQLWGAGSITLDQGGTIDSIDQQYTSKTSDVTLNIGGDLHFNGFSANNSNGGYLHITNTSDKTVYMVRHVSEEDAGSITTWDALVEQIQATNNFNIDSDVGFGYATAADIEIRTGSASALGHAFKVQSGAIYFGGSDESYSFAQETLVEKGATMGIRSGATVTLTGGISGAGSLALNGGTAILGSGKDLSIGKLELTAAGSAVTLDAGGKLGMASFTRANGSSYTLRINITGLTNTPDASWTYQLFDIGEGSSFVDAWWELIDLDNISVTGLDTQLYKVVIDDRNGATGKLRLAYTNLSGLYHEVGTDGFSWKEETTDNDWLQNAYNSPINSGWTTEVGVHLRAAKDADESVIVTLEADKDGIVQAKDLTIDGGSIIFKGDKLELAEGLTVDKGAEALFSAELELGENALLHGVGTVGVTGSGSTLTLNIDQLDADNNAQNGEKFTGTLKAADGGTLELTGSWADDSAHFDTAGGILSLGSASKSGSFSMGISSLEVGGLHFAQGAQLQMSIEGDSKPAVSSKLIIGQEGITGLSSSNQQKITFGAAFEAMTSSDLRQRLGKTGVQLFDVSAWENRPADWNQWFTFTDPTDENAWRYSLKLKEDGLFVYTINPNVKFIWDGKKGNKGEGSYNRQLVWSATDTDPEWWLQDQNHNDSYNLWVNDEDATVVFRNGGKTDEVVIDGKVSAGKVTVESGNYVFHTHTSSNKDSLTFTGMLSVAKGASVEFGVDGTVKNHGTAKGGADRVDWFMANVHLHDVHLEGSMTMTSSVEILGALTGSGDITISGRIVTNKAEESSDLDLMLAHTDDYLGRIIFADCATDKLLPDRRIAGRIRVLDQEGVELQLKGGVVLGKDDKASNGLIEFTADHQRVHLGSISGEGQLRLQGSNHSIAAQEQNPGNLYKSYFGEVIIEGDSMDFKGGLNVYDDIVVRLKKDMTVNGIRGWLGNYGGDIDATNNKAATLYVNLTENINTGTNQQAASNFTFKKGFTLEFNGGAYTQVLDSVNYYTQEGKINRRTIDFENDLRVNSGTLSVRYESNLCEGEIDLEGGVLEFRSKTYITSTFVRGDKKEGTLRLYNVVADVLNGGETGILQFAQGNNARLNLGGDLTVAGLSFADTNVNKTHIYRYEKNKTDEAVTLTVENFGLDFNAQTARQLTIHEGINTIFEQDVKIGGTASEYILNIEGEAHFRTSLNLYKNAYIHLGDVSTAKLLYMGTDAAHNGEVTIDKKLTAYELRGTVATPQIIGDGLFELAWEGKNGSYSGRILTDWLYSGKGDFEMKGYFGLQNETRRNLTITNGHLLFGANSKQAMWGDNLIIGTQGAAYGDKTPTLEMSTDAAKNFNRVELYDDGRLIVSNATNWNLATTGNVTNNTGTLELRNLKSGKTESSESILNLLMGNEAGINTLGYLELTGSTILSVNAENSKLAFEKVKNVLIDKKAALVMQADNAMQNHVLHTVDVRGTLDLQNGGKGAGITAHHLATQGTQGVIMISITGERNTTGLGSKINLDTWESFADGSQLTLSLGEGSDDVLYTLIDKRYKLFTDELGDKWLEDVVAGLNPNKDWAKNSFRVTDYDKDKYYIWLDDEGYLNIRARAEVGPGEIDDELYWDGGVFADVGRPDDHFTWNTWAQEDPNDGITDWRLGPEGEYVDFSYKNVHFTSSVEDSTVSFEGELHARNMTVYRNAYIFYGVAGIANDAEHSLTVDNLTLYGGEFSDVTFKDAVVTVLERLASETSKKNERASATAVIQLDNATLNAQTGGNMGYMYMRGNSTLNLGDDFYLLDGFEASEADYTSAGIGGINSAVKSTSEEARDLELSLQVISEQRSLWGNVSIGEADKRINITKSGEGMQRFGHGAFTLHGDLIIEEGAVGFVSFTGKDFTARTKSDIYGTVTGGKATLLEISGGHKLTVHGADGLAGSIHTLRFTGAGEASTLGLEGAFIANELSLGEKAQAAVEFCSATEAHHTFTVTEHWVEELGQSLTISTTAAAGKALLQKGADLSGTLTVNKGVHLLIEESSAQLIVSGEAHLHGGATLAGNLALTGGLLTVGETVTAGTMTNGTSGVIVFDAQNHVLDVKGGTDMSEALIIKGTDENQGGTVKWGKTANIGGALTLIGKMNMLLGGDLNVAGLVQNTRAATRTEANKGGAGGVSITANGSSSTLTINADNENYTLWGDFTLGSAADSVNLTKKGEKTQTFGAGLVSINGEVDIQAGTLQFRHSAQNSIITGAVSRGEIGYEDGIPVPGNGFLELAGGRLVLAQGGSVYGLDVRKYGDDSELTLGKDLEVFDFREQNTQGGDIVNGSTGRDVYLIWNVGQDGKDEQDIDAFLNAYRYDDVSVGKSGEGVLTFTQGTGLATAKNFKIYETQVVFTAGEDESPSDYVINGGFIGEDDTTLTVGKASLSLMSGGTSSGWVELAGDKTAFEETRLKLGNELTTAGLLGSGGFVDVAQGTSAATLHLVVAGIPEGGTAESVPQPEAQNVTFSEGISLLKTGDGTQTILGNSAFNGANITVKAGELTLHGSAVATGDINVTKGTLALTGSADKEVQGSINVKGSESIFTATKLNQSARNERVTVTDGGYMRVAGKTVFEGDVSITGGGTLSLGGEDGDSSSNVTKNSSVLVSGSGSTLELKMHEWTYGVEGTLTLANDSQLTLAQTELPGSFLVADIVLAELILGDKAQNGLSGTLTWAAVTGNQDLRIDKLSGTGTLDAQRFDGTAESKDHRHLYLELIENFEGSVTGSYKAQNGANKLYVGTIDMSIDSAAGSISIGSPSDALLYANTFRKKGAGKFNLGNVVQIERGLWMTYEGSIQWADWLEKNHEYHKFLMCDQVTLHYEETTARLVEKNGQKSLEGLASRFELHSSLFNPNWSYISLDITGVKYEMFEDRNNEDSLGGYYLGIVYDENGDDASTIYNKLTDKSFVLLDDVDVESDKYEIKWLTDNNGVQKLYLYFNNISDDDLDDNGFFKKSPQLWDTRWDFYNREVLVHAPSKTTMERNTYGKNSQNIFADAKGRTEFDGTFAAEAVELMRDSKTDGGAYVDKGKGWSFIRLETAENLDNPEHKHASVIGGKIYTDKSELEMQEGINTFISYQPIKESAEGTVTPEQDDKAWLHLLVGGSSCLVSIDGDLGNQAYGGFVGDTHIQMDGGNVDYIVGGNHVNNSTFTFKGHSFISVFNGQVRGGIVGGSTLTRGANNSSLYAFHGDSHIHIYTMLSDTAPEEVDMSLSTGTIEGGESFYAVVGGNAWVADADESVKTRMTPTFLGNSYIYIDVAAESQQTKGIDGIVEVETNQGWNGQTAFSKAIVGANYTAITNNGGANSAKRNTLFRGDTSITLNADEEHHFAGGINGASRRASGGAGATVFNGNTRVDIHGGTHEAAVAGGFWFEDTATGAHDAFLLGNTQVTIDGGNFWRVTGGSWSLGGDENAKEIQVGSSKVSISGGKFQNKSATPTDISFVAGGDYYKGNQGQGHERLNGAVDLSNYPALEGMNLAVGDALQGDTTVEITGGTFEGMHIIGGDYANASPTDNGENTMCTSIGGKSSVSLSKGVTVDGFVAGGSYLYDTATGGSVSANETAVSVTGANITAAVDNHQHHAGLAIVGGHVLIDEGNKHGDHIAEVKSRTTLTLSGKSNITGDIVGGSFANESDDANTLTSKRVYITIDLAGNSSINGSIYGGHYSMNTTTPDTLSIDDIRISMTNGTVKGDIVGGGMRMTANDTDGTSSTQGNIYISLMGGTLAGNVYAAGYNGSEKSSGMANTSTTSTHITIGTEFVFSGQETLISGGYGRASEGIRRGSIDNNAKLTYNAKLTFLGSNESINKNGEHVRLEDVDVVDVQNEGKIQVGTELFVLKDKENFTKEGTGTLSITRLTMRDADDKGEKDDRYTGMITVDDGYLVLTGDTALSEENNQTLSGGLTVNLSKYETHYRTQDKAYLQNHENTTGGVLFVNSVGATKPADKANLTFDGLGKLGGSIYFGLYYLATGLDEVITRENMNDYFDYSKAVDDLVVALSGRENYYWIDVQIFHNSLVLRVRHELEKEGWWWTGESSDTWTNTPTDHEKWEQELTYNWTQQETQLEHYNPTEDTKNQGDTDGTNHAYKLTPRGKDVHFGSGAALTEVAIDTRVDARSVWVEQQQYTFTGGALYIGDAAQEDFDHDTDLNLTEDAKEKRLGMGELAVGGSYLTGEYTPAELTLQVEMHASKVLLKDKGALVLDHAGAMDNTAEIVFDGGTLAYGAQGLYTTDLSRQVNAGEGGNNLVRLRVGDTGREQDDDHAFISADPKGADLSVTWGSATAQRSIGGIAQALDNGLVKTGVGQLKFIWSGTADEAVNGSLKALEGVLTYHRAGQGAATLNQYDAADNVEVAEGAKLIFETEGGAELRVERAIEGEGHVVIGSRKTAGQNYTLSADNTQLTGVLELLGDSEPKADDLLTLEQEKALGGADTTLRLSGRHFLYTGSAGEKTVEVKELQVTDGSTTYVGGLTADAANEHIRIQSRLVLTDAEGDAAKSDHSGIIANAWGSADGKQAFRHTIVGDLTQYKGLILAGAAATKGISTLSAAEPSSASTWTLTSDATATQTLSLTLGGAGSFIFAYAADVRLTGQIGTTEAGEANALTSLVNDTKGHLVYLLDGTGSDWRGKSGKNIATGSLTGEFQLGEAENFGTWAGKSLTAGASLTLVNGMLLNAMTKADDSARLNVRTVYTDAAAPDTERNTSTRVSVGGTDGSMFNDITITAGGQMLDLTGEILVDGSHSSVSLTFGAADVANDYGSPEQYMIVARSKDSKAALTVTESGLNDFRLNVDNTAFRTALVNAIGGKEGHNDTYLHVIGNGLLNIDSSLDDDLLTKVKGDNIDLLNWLGFTAAATEGDILLHWQMGDIEQEKSLREIYLVIDAEDWNGIEPDPYTVNGYGVLSSHYKATFVDDDHTLTLNLSGKPEEQEPMGKDAEELADHTAGIMRDISAGGAIVNNLVGMQTGRVEIHRSGGDDRVKVVLRNTQYTYPNPAEGNDGIIGGEPFEPQGVYGVNTQFWGDIIADAGVDMDKIGPGRLTIGFEREHTGSLQLADGTLSLIGGGITLTGTGNTMGALRFARTAETLTRPVTDEEPGDLLLRHGHTTIGSITEANEKNLTRQGGDIALQDGALLTLTGESRLADTTLRHIEADHEPASELQLAEGGALSLTGTEIQLSGVGLVLEEGGLLDVGSSRTNSVLGITGAGELAGSGAQLCINGNMQEHFSSHRGVTGYVFSGSLTGGLGDEDRNTLTIKDGAWLKMQNATGGHGWDVDNHGELIIDLGYADNNTKLGDITLRSGSTTTLIVDTDKGSRELPTLHGGVLTIEQGAKFILDTTGASLEGEPCAEGTRFGVAWVSGNRREMDNAEFIKGSGLLHYEIDDKYIEKGVFWLVFTKNDNNIFDRPGMDKNPSAGAGLVWDATDPDKNDKWGDIKDNPFSDLNSVVDSLLDQEASGDWDGMQSTLAAVAGASTSALGMAAIEDMHRQLRTTRNRSVTSSSERCWNGVDCPTLLHAYIMGEGNYHKMNADRYAPGFTFSNWGGTVGMDVDINRHGTDSTNLGLSLTAMYGNLTVDAADRAKGDLDTQYLTAFGRITKGKWQHTLVLSAGLMDLTLNRTVNYGTGAYTTHGSTDGYALGALYEIGYNAFTNEAGTKCLQFVANAEARRIELDGYTERSASDAALHVGDITQEVFTFGLGARYRSVVGYNVWNRASTFEARVLAKADVGDRSGKVSNALINGTSRREEVESAKLGVFGVEAGTGITIPCGRCGSFFIDTSVELRDGYLNADANAGYRMTF